jgi:hypothetical protein
MDFRQCPKCGYEVPLKLYLKRSLTFSFRNTFNCSNCKTLLTRKPGWQFLIVLLSFTVFIFPLSYVLNQPDTVFFKIGLMFFAILFFISINSLERYQEVEPREY